VLGCAAIAFFWCLRQMAHGSLGLGGKVFCLVLFCHAVSIFTSRGNTFFFAHTANFAPVVALAQITLALNRASSLQRYD
jgi:hypothetical protein